MPPAAPVAPSPQPPQPVSQPNPWASVQNSLSNDVYNLMYGASRALNGMTYGGLDYLGNKLGSARLMTSYNKTLIKDRKVM